MSKLLAFSSLVVSLLLIFDFNVRIINTESTDLGAEIAQSDVTVLPLKESQDLNLVSIYEQYKLADKPSTDLTEKEQKIEGSSQRTTLNGMDIVLRAVVYNGQSKFVLLEIKHGSGTPSQLIKLFEGGTTRNIEIIKIASQSVQLKVANDTVELALYHMKNKEF